MSNRIKFYFKPVLAFCLGIIVGFGSWRLLPLIESIFPNVKEVEPIVNLNHPQVIGFLPYWLLSRADHNYPNYLNNFTYFGLQINPDGTLQKLVNPQEQEPGWTALDRGKLDPFFTAAQKNRLNLSLLVHLSKESTIDKLMTDPVTHAQNLVREVVPIMREHGFTDLNLDIESFVEATPGAQESYTAFVSEVRRGINASQAGTLSLDIAPITLFTSRLTDAKSLAPLVDSLILMAYDYHYSSSYNAGPVSPVSGAGTVREFDVESSLQQLLQSAPASKIVLGIPLYGYEWETLNDTPGAPVIPGGGVTASNQRVQEMLATCTNCTFNLDPIAGQPYVTFPDGDYFHQIYYEDAQSLQSKITLAQQYHLAGVALWALGYESDTMLHPLTAYKSSILP